MRDWLRDLAAQMPELQHRFANLPEWAKLAISAAALVLFIYLAIKLLAGFARLLEWLQQRYWESSPAFRRRYKWSVVGLATLGIVGGVVAGIVRYFVRHSQGLPVYPGEFLPSGSDTQIQYVFLVMALLGVLQVFFLSWCKSRRGEMVEKLLEAGDLVHALEELEQLRTEPGQNISVDVQVDCLHAYALVLAGHEQRALECLLDSESRMSGSAKLQDYLPYSSAHRLRYNEEAIEMMRLRIAGILCELGQYAQAVELTRKPVSQITTDIARHNVRGIALGALGALDDARDAFLSGLRLAKPLYYDEKAQQEVRSVQRNLGQCLLLLHQFGDARYLVEQAQQSLSSQLAPGHPDVIDCKVLLARVYAAQGHTAVATELLERVMDDEMHFLAAAAAGMREADMLRLVRRMQSHFQNYLSLVCEHHSADSRRLSVALGHVIRRKGLALQASAWSRRLSASVGPRGQRLQRVREQLSNALFAASGGHTQVAAEGIAQLDEERKRLEAEQARESDERTVQALLEDVTLDQVWQSLPRSSALVEFVSVLRERSRAPEQPGRLHYLALVLTKERPAPALFDLGPAEPLDRLAAQFHQQMENFDRGDRRARPEWPALSSELYRALVSPWERLVGGAAQLILSPDDGLNFVPFAALLGPDGKFLIERFHISSVSSGRDLVQRPVRQPRFHEAPAMLIGDPAFEARASGGNGRGRRRDRGLGTNPLVAPALVRPRTMFPPLPGTRREVEEIGSLLRGRTLPFVEFFGRDAGKRVLLGTRSPRILHLATHAFFLPPLVSEASGASGFLPNLGFGRVDRDTPFGGLRGMAVSPYVRSGLALAGAVSDGAADSRGLLTAEEVLSMQLDGTDLVVLSACQTAVGTSVSGEGVQGLHRAFLIAGAKSVIASLWKVPDEETARLMQSFYGQYLRTGRKGAALREAMLELIPELKRLPEGSHPALWSAFVCFGPPDPE